MAIAWSSPKTPPPYDGAVRSALASCTTGTEAATAGAQDGLDCRQLSTLQVAVETAAKASGTIQIAGMLPGDTVTVNGQLFTAVGQDGHPTNVQFKAGADIAPDRGDDWITAANLAAAIAAHGVGATVTAFAASDIALVTVQALADGAAGNAFALLTSSARAVVSGATLAGGLAAGAIAAGATLQFSGINPLTGRWSRLPDLDVALVAGLANQVLNAVPIPAGATRLQAVPNGVGAACAVYLNGMAGRIP